MRAINFGKDTRATNVRNYEGIITTATMKGVGVDHTKVKNVTTRGTQLWLIRRKYE